MKPSPSAPRTNVVQSIFVFSVSLVFLVTLADTNGFEGDDLNTVVPMFQLSAALEGHLTIYRYAWQPLTYWTGASVFWLTGSPSFIFWSGSLAIAASVAMLFHILVSRIKVPAVVAGAILLMVPEIFYSGLYFTPSSYGFLFATLAVVLIFERADTLAALLVGACVTVAILMRLDFVLGAPAIFALLFHRTKNFRAVFLAGLAAAIVMVFAMATGLFSPFDAFEIRQGRRKLNAIRPDFHSPVARQANRRSRR